MSPAPLGNKFAIGNSGRSKEFESPEELEIFIEEYFNCCDNNPLIKIEFNGKDAERCEVPTQRPYTIEGLCLHLDIDRRTLLNYSKKKGYEEFFHVIQRAKRKITDQYVSFGLAGGYNANLVRFLLSNNTEYKDKVEVENKGSLRIKWNEEKTYDDNQLNDAVE